MKSRYLHLASLLLLFMASSCTKDWRDNSPEDKPESNSQIVLRIKTPAGFSSGAASRSLTVDDERAINNVWVLAFNAAGDLTEIRQGENLTDVDATTRSFTATLQRSKSASDTYNLMVLANAEDIIKNKIGIDVEAVADKSYAAIAELLSETIGSKMYATGGAIPMWGESGALEIKLGVNNNISLSLMRAVARIDVGIGSPTHQADGTYKWSGKDGKDNIIPFELTEVYVVKANDRYAVVPGTSNVTDNKVTVPSVPTGATPFTMEQSKTGFKFEGAEITASVGEFGSYTTQSIYIPEADVKQGPAAKSGDENHENRMAVIVGGDYNNSGKTTYYRLDLAKKGEILDALRNHLYQFNISKVSGMGYGTIDEAYTSRSMNMQVEILEWDESDMDEVLFDGQYYFSIDKRKVEFSPMGDETTTVRIKTNVKSFEMWEQREGGEHLEIKVGGTTTFTNKDMGYIYTLSTVAAGSVYDLKIEATKHNVSNTVPDRLDKWKIKANRLNASFEVDQQYTVLYVSYVNGQSQNLYPEGTMANTIQIDIMALVPVEIKAEENGVAASWIKLGDIAGLTTGKDGLYQARLTIEVDPFAFDPLNIAGIRTGVITVIPQDEAPRVFTINQEMPVFKFAKATEIVSRQSGKVYHTYVDLITNLQEVDYKVVDGTATGTEAWRIARKENLYNVDKTNPRSRRFDVDVDMMKDIPMGADAFEKSFTATPDIKYGAITPPVILFQVLKGSNYFDWFWHDAVVPPLVVPYAFPKEDNSMQYIFPWQTTSATFHFNSNNGLLYDAANTNNKPRQGTIVKGEDISMGDYTTTPYTFTFNKANNNTLDSYDLYFKSTIGATTLSKNVKLGLGVQMWKRNPASATVDVSYKGYTQAAPYVLNVTSNVDWEAMVTSPADASFVKMRPSATAAWIAPPMRTDDRVTTPEVIEAYNAETNLVKTAAMGITIEPYNTLNATPATREVKLLFANQSLNASSSGIPNTSGAIIADPVLTVTQYAPVLTYTSGAPTKNIPASGDEYVIKAKTNIQSWGVKIYTGADNSGTLLVSKTFGNTPIIPFNTITERSVSLILAKNPSSTNTRQISFYLYYEDSSKDSEVKITTQTQNIRVVPSTNEGVYIGGMYWAKGNLIADGAFGSKIGVPEDDGLHFFWGSLLGWSVTANGDGTGRRTEADPKLKCAKPYDLSFTPIFSHVETNFDPLINIGGAGYNLTTQYNGGTDNPMVGLGDACRYYLGAPWRMPTKSDAQALINATTYYNTNTPWVAGQTNSYQILTATNNSVTLKLPANGDFWSYGKSGGYWSSTAHKNSQSAEDLVFREAGKLDFSGFYRNTKYGLRCVRP